MQMFTLRKHAQSYDDSSFRFTSAAASSAVVSHQPAPGLLGVSRCLPLVLSDWRGTTAPGAARARGARSECAIDRTGPVGGSPACRRRRQSSNRCRRRRRRAQVSGGGGGDPTRSAGIDAHGRRTAIRRPRGRLRRRAQAETGAARLRYQS